MTAERKRMARTYNQDCILAHAFDLLGERWTFLIIRDLFLGPQRFGDLQAGLCGIGANLLSKRLKELEEAGLIATDGVGRGRYYLTPSGEGLRPAIREIMSWAIHYFHDRDEPGAAHDCIYSNDLQPDSVALATELFVNHNQKADLNYVAHLFIDEFPYTLYNMNGEVTVRRGADAPAVAKLSADVETIMKSFRGELTLAETRARISASGDQAAVNHIIGGINKSGKYDAQKLSAAN